METRLILQFLALGFLVLGLIYLFLRRTGNAAVDAPVVGTKNGFTARYHFFKDAPSLIDEGYGRFKDRMFKLSSNDMLVLPSRYVEELRNMSDDRISAMEALVDNFGGLYSTARILLDGNLHNETIQSKLTPRLGVLVPRTQLELERGLAIEIPPAANDDFTSIKGFNLVLRLISYIAARHFVGPELCRNEEWLATNRKYTENTFRTVILLRIFPDWLKPIVNLVNPFSYRVAAAERQAKRMVFPVIQKRRVDGQGKKEEEKPNDLLQWMMDRANDRDARPESLAQRLLILTLASVHTTSMTATQVLFDLCAHPEYVDPLREELLEAMDKTDGKITKQTLNHLRKMDSFFRESQRLSPTSLLGFKRRIKKPTTLSDGTYLPKGVHAVFPIAPVVTDPDIVSHPHVFDGFRHYKNREAPGAANRHQFVTTNETNLHFGHGKYACPGRFFASNTMKLLFSNLLLRYEFRFAGGTVQRPPNLHLHEYQFPNPEAMVEFRLRERSKV